MEKNFEELLIKAEKDFESLSENAKQAISWLVENWDLVAGFV